MGCQSVGEPTCGEESPPMLEAIRILDWSQLSQMTGLLSRSTVIPPDDDRSHQENTHLLFSRDGTA
jgi:hypothetical protein